MSAVIGLPPFSERVWQGRVVELAETLGYLVYHTHDSRRSAPGFPDLVLVRALSATPGRVVFAELKTDTGRLTAEQEVWLKALRLAGAEAYVWKPRDWPQVVEVLR